MPNQIETEESRKIKWVQDEVLSFLMRNAPASVFSSIVVIAIFAGANFGHVIEEPERLIWLCLALLLGVIRTVYLIVFNRYRAWFTNAQWLSCYRILTLCSGLIYGFMMILFFYSSSEAVQLLTIFVVIGMPAAAVGLHSVDIVTYRLFSAVIIVPTAFTLFFADSEFNRFSTSIIIVFAVVMDRSASLTARALRDNIELTYKMSYRATHDSLVDLYNRKELETQFESKAQVANQAIAMLFVDLDNFKALNDSLGHQAGDDALRKVAGFIRHNVREGDIAARLGGDEFAVILYVDNQSEAIARANKILKEIGELPFKNEYDGLSASIGISFHSDCRVSFSRLMRVADLACYKSKEAGKNSVTLLQYLEAPTVKSI